MPFFSFLLLDYLFDSEVGSSIFLDTSASFTGLQGFSQNDPNSSATITPNIAVSLPIIYFEYYDSVLQDLINILPSII
jgi:hypothetical protein